VAANARSRTVILTLASLAHVGLILLLAGGIGQVRAPVREAEPLFLTPVDDLKPEPQPAQVPSPVLTPPSEVFTGPLPEIDSTGSAYAPPVSDLEPEVDWIDERRREVANVLARARGETPIRLAKSRCSPAGTERVRGLRPCSRAGAASRVDR
jgi:hypothetical protein